MDDSAEEGEGDQTSLAPSLDNHGNHGTDSSTIAITQCPTHHHHHHHHHHHSSHSLDEGVDADIVDPGHGASHTCGNGRLADTSEPPGVTKGLEDIDVSDQSPDLSKPSLSRHSCTCSPRDPLLRIRGWVMDFLLLIRLAGWEPDMA